MRCQPAIPREDKKGREGIKYHGHIRSVTKESSAIQKPFIFYPLILYIILLACNTAISRFFYSKGLCAQTLLVF